MILEPQLSPDRIKEEGLYLESLGDDFRQKLSEVKKARGYTFSDEATLDSTIPILDTILSDMFKPHYYKDFEAALVVANGEGRWSVQLSDGSWLKITADKDGDLVSIPGNMVHRMSLGPERTLTSVGLYTRDPSTAPEPTYVEL